jgi:hypothetical protein
MSSGELKLRVMLVKFASGPDIFFNAISLVVLQV